MKERTDADQRSCVIPLLDGWRRGRDLRAVLGFLTCATLGAGIAWLLDVYPPDAICVGIAAGLIWALCYAIQGTVLQDYVVRQVIAETSTACARCGTTGDLRVLDVTIYWGVVVFFVLHRRVTTYCPPCARRILWRAIAGNLLGSVLCPALWIWALLTGVHKLILISRIGSAGRDSLRT